MTRTENLIGKIVSEATDFVQDINHLKTQDRKKIEDFLLESGP